MADEFKPGDVVRLKSDPLLAMTVESVGDEYGEPAVFCVWIEKGKKCTASFAPTTLTKI